MRLNHNIFSLNIFGNYSNSLNESDKALRKISSGLKINGAKDNPNKISQNEGLRIQIRNNSIASKNIQDTASMIQTFDSAMQEINNTLVRIKELSVQANTDSCSLEDKEVAQKEIDNMLKNIDYLCNNTEFNSIKLIDENNKTVKGLVGSLEGEEIEIPKFNLTTKSLFPNGLDVTTHESAEEALEFIDKATEKVGLSRSIYGSMQLKLENSKNRVEDINLSLERSQSKIGDADIAEEMLKYTTKQIIVKSSLALMSQSNQLPQDALRMLENVR